MISCDDAIVVRCAGDMTSLSTKPPVLKSSTFSLLVMTLYAKRSFETLKATVFFCEVDFKKFDRVNDEIILVLSMLFCLSTMNSACAL